MLSKKELIDKFQKWGWTLVPLQDNVKKPKSKKINGEWRWKKKFGVEWSNDELLSASRLGVEHDESGIIDIDFDDPIARKFMHLLPETLTIGKEVKDE